MNHTEEWLQIMKKIKRDLDTSITNKYSRNSSNLSEYSSEQPVNIGKDVKNKLNELIEYMIVIIEKIKKTKTKQSQEISNLKNAICMLSDLYVTNAKKFSNED